MEWVETTARSVDEAKELALDQLGVVADDAEFEVLEAPRPGLFGRIRGEARVRARVRPAPVRPKVDRRRSRRSEVVAEAVTASDEAGDGGRPGRRRGRSSTTSQRGQDTMTTSEPQPEATSSTADVGQVRDAAVEFVRGLTSAFGLESAVDAVVDGTEIEVRVAGASLGLLIGPGGRTLLGIQDLARVAAQRRLGDHETRLRVDVAGYREKRRLALERFAGTVAEKVRETGIARSLDAMPSADRKVLHDVLAGIDGVTSRSEGEEPNRRVVVSPA